MARGKRAKEKPRIQSASNRKKWEERSDTSQSSKERHHEPKHNRGRVDRPRKEYHTQNLSSSFLTVDEAGSIMPETPEAALVAS
jgi:hypothetical protein